MALERETVSFDFVSPTNVRYEVKLKLRDGAGYGMPNGTRDNPGTSRIAGRSGRITVTVDAGSLSTFKALVAQADGDFSALFDRAIFNTTKRLGEVLT